MRQCQSVAIARRPVAEILAPALSRGSGGLRHYPELGLAEAHDSSINPLVIIDHSLGGESLFEVTPASGPRDRFDLSDRRDQFVEFGRDKSANPGRHYLANRSARPRYNRGPARHRFDHRKPKRLGPIDRKQQRERAAEESA